MGLPPEFHWHASTGVEIDYIATDHSRGKIPWVRVKNAKGEVKEFVVDGFDMAKAGGERRRMDCVDCHNKVAHPFAASAERAVDRAFADGRLDARLPYLRREAVKLLKAEYPTHEQASTAIASALREVLCRRGRCGGPRRPRPGEGGKSRTRGSARRVCLPGDESHVRYVHQQRRPHRHRRLLPVSRRRAQGKGWLGDQAGLRDLPPGRGNRPRDPVSAPRASGTRATPLRRGAGGPDEASSKCVDRHPCRVHDVGRRHRRVD